MPPRVVKRGGSAAKRAGRPPKKGQNQQAEEPAKVEEMAEVKDEGKAIIEQKPIVQEEKEKEEHAVREGKPIVMVDINEPHVNDELDDTVSLKKENEVKDSVDEYGKDERLELDDNEPDYEPEEYCGVDYDEKEMEQEDVQEVGDEEEENPDEDNLGEEEGDVHEELEDIPEEVEGEEDDEHASEEQAHQGLVDADDEEHHEVVNERRKRKEFEVFVGGLDKDATEDDLKKVFSQVGEVTEVRLMMNPQTKKNKGFAFLRFATVEQAKRAVTELKNPVINGKQCGVTPSQDSDTLFVGNICRTWTKEALKERLKYYGVENIEDLTLVEDSNNEGMNRGFAFLEFSSRSDAMDGYRRLQKRDVVFGVDRPAKVSFADSFIDPGDKIMAQVKTVFVDGLPPSWDEDRVRELLKKYGKVEKIELARNMPSARRKDYGFVTFDSHDAAVTCAKSINNAELGEGENKAKVRARLSRPLQRGQGKHASHGHLRSARNGGRIVRGPWVRPPPRSLHGRDLRAAGARLPPPAVKRPIGLRDRRPAMSMRGRARPIAPLSRPYPRRPPPPPVPSYPKSSLKRDYGRRDELPPPRSRAAVDYGSRVIPERRPSYRDEYPPRVSGYSDVPRSSSRSAVRRPYVDDGYARFERPPPSYHESRPREYDSVPGMKRPYSAMDDIPPRYADAGVRSSRARLDYDYGSGAQYGDAYGDRLGRSSVGYGGSRSSLSSQDPHGLYGSRHGMSYGGSYGGSDGGGMYSSYGGDYPSRGSDVGSSYSLYSSRGAGGSGYMGTGGSGSYY